SLTVHTLAVKRASKLKEELENIELTNASVTENMLKISADAAKELGMKPYYMYRQKNMVGNFENVGYCLPGKECLYNVDIMEEKLTILAAGAGATTKVYESENNHIYRIYNVKSLDDYISRIDEMIERKINDLPKEGK
ncbi:MAG: coproporphyrinogen dehydrogenase HemZ, partial [Firmicutes bacterium]|nr:coproporphyrinogen dehydrogenase HemZ [Bacillota bacterium]